MVYSITEHTDSSVYMKYYMKDKHNTVFFCTTTKCVCVCVCERERAHVYV